MFGPPPFTKFSGRFSCVGRFLAVGVGVRIYCPLPSASSLAVSAFTILVSLSSGSSGGRLVGSQGGKVDGNSNVASRLGARRDDEVPIWSDLVRNLYWMMQRT